MIGGEEVVKLQSKDWKSYTVFWNNKPLDLKLPAKAPKILQIKWKTQHLIKTLIIMIYEAWTLPS